jgi:hypothetical protein
MTHQTNPPGHIYTQYFSFRPALQESGVQPIFTAQPIQGLRSVPPFTNSSSGAGRLKAASILRHAGLLAMPAVPVLAGPDTLGHRVSSAGADTTAAAATACC